jgi:hypothetical protein
MNLQTLSAQTLKFNASLDPDADCIHNILTPPIIERTSKNYNLKVLEMREKNLVVEKCEF